MGRKRKAYLHIGLPRTGGAFLDSALTQHAEALDALGVRHPAISTEEMFRAAIEIRRDHRAWGYQRREVEGAWAAICRRAHQGREDVIFSQELLAACTPAQIDLLLDGLAGFEIHVIATARDLGGQLLAPRESSVEAGRSLWAGEELGDVLGRWATAVRKPHRVHVVVVQPDAAHPYDAVWGAVGDVVGFDAHLLPLWGAEGAPAVPAAAPDLAPGLYDHLLEVGERWRKQLAGGGYDVHGDTAALLPVPPEPGVPLADGAPAEERLSTATDALANVLVEVARLRRHNQALEERNAKLEQKKQKLKRRLAAAG